MPTGIVYAVGSKIPRRFATHEDQAVLTEALTPGEGEALFFHPGLETIPAKTVMALLGIEREEDVHADHRLRAAIMLETGEDAIPSGRCAVVHPTSRMVSAFIVADPALDRIERGQHFLASATNGRELHCSDDAKLNDKIMPDGSRLCRCVKGDRDGKVEAVEWVAPADMTPDHVEDSTARVGETVEALKLTDAPMGDTERF